jgi:hypothetical protein
VAVTNQFTNVTWADFGYQLPSLIDGHIWNDLNRSSNSMRDPSEPFLAGVVVTLTNSVKVVTATTDANGYYRFVGNYNGVFNVMVDTNRGPLGTGTWTQTFDKDAVAASANRIDGTIAMGGNSSLNDFSYYQSGAYSIGDTVFKDWNGNAMQDTGEGGIPNLVVSLYRDNSGDGVYDASDGFITTTISNSNGFYQFANLPDGGVNYVVVVNRDGTNLPNSYVQTYDPVYPVGTICTVCDDQGNVGLQASNVITMDFG